MVDVDHQATQLCFSASWMYTRIPRSTGGRRHGRIQRGRGGNMGSGGMTVAQPLDIFVEPHEAARLAAEITLLFCDEGLRLKRTKAGSP